MKPSTEYQMQGIQTSKEYQVQGIQNKKNFHRKNFHKILGTRNLKISTEYQMQGDRTSTKYSMPEIQTFTEYQVQNLEYGNLHRILDARYLEQDETPFILDGKVSFRRSSQHTKCKESKHKDHQRIPDAKESGI